MNIGLLSSSQLTNSYLRGVAKNHQPVMVLMMYDVCKTLVNRLRDHHILMTVVCGSHSQENGWFMTLFLPTLVRINAGNLGAEETISNKTICRMLPSLSFL